MAGGSNFPELNDLLQPRPHNSDANIPSEEETMGLRRELATDEAELQQIYSLLHDIYTDLQHIHALMGEPEPSAPQRRADTQAWPTSRYKRGPQGQRLSNYSALFDRVGGKLDGMSKRVFRRGVVNDYI